MICTKPVVTLWARLYLNTASLDAEINAGKVKITKGEKADLEQIFNMYDKFKAA